MILSFKKNIRIISFFIILFSNGSYSQDTRYETIQDKIDAMHRQYNEFHNFNITAQEKSDAKYLSVAIGVWIEFVMSLEVSKVLHLEIKK